MSDLDPPTPPPQPPYQKTQYESTMHTLSLSLLVVCPIILFLPPRKIDFYSFSLVAAWGLSAERVYTERRLSRQRLAALEGEEEGGSKKKDGGVGWSLPGQALPTEKAREVQARFEMKRRRERGDDGADGVGGKGGGEEKEEATGGVVGMARRLWMGNETAGWQERRGREERERLEAGESYADLILGQIREVWFGVKEDGEGGKGGEEGGSGEEKGK